MRALIAAAILGSAAAALLPATQAKAWWDPYGVWHPDVVRPYYAPPPPPVYYRPVHRWIPPHWNRWGRFIPGHWA